MQSDFSGNFRGNFQRIYPRIFLFWICGLVLLFSFLFHILLQFPDGRIHIFFLDVGQGDAILIQTARGQNILVDSGPSKNILKAFSKIDALPFFNRRIDLALVTHFEKDHGEGFLAVLERYEVDRIFLSGVMRGSNLEKKFFEKIAALRQKDGKDIPLELVSSDRDLQIDENTFLDFLYPFHSEFRFQHDGSLNETSVTFRLLYGKKSLLYSGGDSGFSLEETLMKKRFDLSAAVLKVSHHGSKYSTGEKFLRLVNPHMAVISSGRNNSYGHPHPDTLSRLSRTGVLIRRTDLEGTVEIVF